MDKAHLELTKLMRESWQWRLDVSPELAASLGLLPERRSTHSLDPRSAQSFSDRLEYIKRSLRDCTASIEKAGGVEKLEKTLRLGVELFHDQLKTYVDNSKYESHLQCINRLEGPQTDLPLYASYLPLGTKKEVAFYIDFLSNIKKQNSEVITLLKEGMEKKNLPAKCSLDGVPAQFISHVDSLGSAFLKKVYDSKSAYVTEEVKAKAKDIVENQVVPSFQEIADFLTDVYVPSLPTEIASTKRHPFGSEYYQSCLEFHTTTTLNCREIHEIGLKEVERITKEMRRIAEVEGYEDLEGYKKYLTTSDDFKPKSEEELLKNYRDICGRICPALLRLFHVKTLPSTPFQIIPTPSRSASSAPAAYYLAGGGSRPRTFYANTSHLSTRYTYECDALSLHEAIPGHHTQASVSAEQEGLEGFRKYQEDRRYFEAPARFPFYTGYVEGWGLHCEGLGKELGIYNKPSDEYGALSMEMLRAVRLVVDTGMHGLGWSWDRAYKYILANTAISEQDASVETTRYVTWPGQACAYKIGQMEISRLRKMFEDETGENGDVRDFYHVVLCVGAVPLTILEEKIRDLIEKISGGGPGGMTREVQADTSSNDASAMANFLAEMTFANTPAWCKCCVVPGSHGFAASL